MQYSPPPNTLAWPLETAVRSEFAPAVPGPIKIGVRSTVAGIPEFKTSSSPTPLERK